ncbi:hypothetical protein RQP46_000391 [Phenoliferia psychrophenolica]
MNTSSLNTPDWLDTGDNAWQLTAATLVGLQSIPGLMILYGGVVKRKWAINSAFMVLVAFAEVLVCWVIWAYKMGFGEQWGAFPLVGRPGPQLKITEELAQALLPAAGGAENFPLSTMIWFQFVFAAITLVLIAGAFLGRMNFLAWVIFVPLWLTFSYTVGAFSIWGGGFLFERGVMDYSGGYVIHLSSGTAGFVGSFWIGPRLASDRADFRPNNILMAMAGVFGTKPGSIAFAITNPGAAVDGNWKQLYIQLYSALFVIGLNIFMTSLIMNFIKHVCRVPLRMTEAQLLIGDEACHGETAYAFDMDSVPHRDIEAGATDVTHREFPKTDGHGA